MEKNCLQHDAEGSPQDINPDEFSSLSELFQTSVEKYTEHTAFANFGSQLSYAEFEQHSLKLASYLQNELHLQKGERIALMMPNLMQYAVALYAALRAGLIIVNVNPLYTPRELLHQLNDAEAQTIIIWADISATLASIIEQTALKNIITTQTDDLLDISLAAKPVDKKLAPAITFPDALHSAAGTRFHAPDIVGNDLAFLQYTGGTTGVSKAAMLSHRNIIANMLQVCAIFSGTLKEGEDIIITALPLYHIYALTCNFFAAVMIGGLNVLITNPRDLPAMVDELSRWKFTYITGVNTLYNGLLHTPGFAELDFSALTVSSAGGMALQTRVSAKWQALTGCVMVEGYGLSETSPVLTCNPIHIKEHVGSVGLALPSTELSIIAADGTEVATGETGELCARGPQVMPGYWRNEAATNAVMTAAGYFRTGDIARVDAQGFFYIIDRKKDMILVSGFNVFPNEVEEVITGLTAVLECACIGVPDEKSGEAVVIYIVKHLETSLNAEQVKQYCADKLAKYKIPRNVIFVDELPKSNVGKILRRELRTRYQQSAS